MPRQSQLTYRDSVLRLLPSRQRDILSEMGKDTSDAVILFLKVPHTYLCAYFITLRTFHSSPSLLGSHFDLLALLVLLFAFHYFLHQREQTSLLEFSFGYHCMSAHFHFLDLRQQEKLGGKRESEREQINCIISAYKLNPRHKCGGSGGAFFCFFFRKRGRETAN